MCIEALRQNEEYYAESFTWFSDLLVDHAEIFLSMFAVDMFAVLESLPPDVWDSFLVFKLLNDYLRCNANLRNGKFHQQLHETFAPQVVRYIDLMESSIAQSIHKGFEQETWVPKGGGCATSEDLLWKLEALQSFIADLHWPEPVFAEHLYSRLKLMASDMLDAAARRTAFAFDAALKRASKGTDFVLPVELCVMFNTCVAMKSRVFDLCSISSGVNMPEYHARTGELLEKLQSQLINNMVEHFDEVLKAVLVRLARYDESAVFSSLLSITRPTDKLSEAYVEFFQKNVKQLRLCINDKLIALSIFDIWYNHQLYQLHDWLVTKRISVSLHPYQVACLSFIVKKLHIDFQFQGVSKDVLEARCYVAVISRLQTDEATKSMKFGGFTSQKPGQRSLHGSLAGSLSSNSSGEAA